jgi:hypothetical protein
VGAQVSRVTFTRFFVRDLGQIVCVEMRLLLIVRVVDKETRGGDDGKLGSWVGNTESSSSVNQALDWRRKDRSQLIESRRTNRPAVSRDYPRPGPPPDLHTGVC